MSRDYDFWVYIVTNQTDSVLYIGMTNDLSRRLREHRSGEIPGFTADYRCHKLVYWEHYSDVEEAIAREKQLKRWSRKKKVELIDQVNPRWLDLFDEISGNI
ncbi:MAG TPA: GIY-YIG nuclease family protein [Chthoniobacterales bacterium]|jgi:putative endonuclease|nr:GIY-YIG nuclease family protein [Chthoniobacterales bacterium]